MILKDELAETGPVGTDTPPGTVREICAAIRNAWMKAGMSGTGRTALERYFTFHLKRLSALEVLSQPGCPAAEALLDLLDDLFMYFGDYLDLDNPAPLLFQQRFLEALRAHAEPLRSTLGELPCSNELAALILQYIDTSLEPSGARFSYRALNYLRFFIVRLGITEPGSEQALSEALQEMDFNHLKFLGHLQEQVRAELSILGDDANRLRLLVRRRAAVLSRPVAPGYRYHPDWPALRTMFAAWLEEEITVLRQSGQEPRAVATNKLALHLSVAQLAFFLHLFYEEGLLGQGPLSELFRSAVSAFSTKRQQEVSAQGLSKAFYSTSQVTAATVRGILQRMIARINRNFFPVCFAISATGLFW